MRTTFNEWEFIECFSIEDPGWHQLPTEAITGRVSGPGQHSFLPKPARLLFPSSLCSPFQTKHLFTYLLASIGPGFHVPPPYLCFFRSRVCLQLTQKGSWPISEPNVRPTNKKCHSASSDSHFVPRPIMDSPPNHVDRNIKL